MDNKEQLREQIEVILHDYAQYHQKTKSTADQILQLLEPQESKEEPLWEVLSYRDSVGNILSKWSDGNYKVHPEATILNYTPEKAKEKLNINAIRIKSTGMVLAVGDRVLWDWIHCVKDYMEIAAIKEHPSKGMCIWSKGGGRYKLNGFCIPGNKWNLRHYKEEPKALLTTVDRYDVKEGDDYQLYGVCEDWEETGCHSSNVHYHKDEKWWKSKEARDEYILLNKPLWSLQEVKDWYNKHWDNHPWQKGYSDIDNFIKITQEKLNNK